MRYNLTELTEEAGISVRTVRYYIAEGLLPPPVSAGPQSHYTQGHLDRLRLIGQLKASYLPLREIRRELAGLDDAVVHRLATETAVTHRTLREAAEDADESVAPPAPASLLAAPPPRDSAADYISRVMARAAGPPGGESDAGQQPMVGRVTFSSPATDSSLLAPRSSSLDTWRRMPLGDDAELLIREESYQRQQDRVDWLVRWARKVFG